MKERFGRICETLKFIPRTLTTSSIFPTLNFHQYFPTLGFHPYFPTSIFHPYCLTLGFHLYFPYTSSCISCMLHLVYASTIYISFVYAYVSFSLIFLAKYYKISFLLEEIYIIFLGKILYTKIYVIFNLNP